MFPGIADRIHKELTMFAPRPLSRFRSFISLLDVGGLTVSLDQSLRLSRTEVLRVDRRIHPGFAQHIPEPMDLQTRVR
jgi:hypothetical protein